VRRENELQEVVKRFARFKLEDQSAVLSAELCKTLLRPYGEDRTK
jgi:hypothetical protein